MSSLDVYFAEVLIFRHLQAPVSSYWTCYWNIKTFAFVSNVNMLQTWKWWLLPERSAIGERWGSGSLCRFLRFGSLCTQIPVILWIFLQIMVFFSSCNSVKFHSELLNYIDIPCLDIHGKQKQQKRTSTYFEFCNAEKGILLCTDVAARGLDIPAVVCFLYQ